MTGHIPPGAVVRTGLESLPGLRPNQGGLSRIVHVRVAIYGNCNMPLTVVVWPQRGFR